MILLLYTGKKVTIFSN